MQSREENIKNQNEVKEIFKKFSDAIEYVGWVLEYKPPKKWVAPRARRQNDRI